MNSLRGRRLKRRGNGLRARARCAKVSLARGLSPNFPPPSLTNILHQADEIQFRYASMRTMSLFPAMFVKFKMSEGQKSFSRYLAQFRYLLTWSVRLQRSNAVRALFLASTNSFFKVPLQVVFRSARFSFSSLWRALLKGWGRVNYSSP